MTTRFLEIPGAFNVRHLGGLQAADGVIHPQAFLRSDSLDELNESGWELLVDHGVSTVIDLRNDDEKKPAQHRPSSVQTIEIALDGVDDDFWQVWGTGPQFGTALYYRPHIERFASLHVQVIEAIAAAAAGTVIIHCSVGRDRTGLVVTEILTLLGVSVDDIVADYALSEARLAALYEHRGVESQSEVILEFLAERGLTPPSALRQALTGLPLLSLLQAAGLSRQAVSQLKQRALTRR